MAEEREDAERSYDAEPAIIRLPTEERRRREPEPEPGPPGR